MKRIDLKNTKLVIWDMDDTFWKGTISESEITPIEMNIELVKKLSDKGIMNSICSKNDFSVCEKELKKLGMWEYFIHPSINWESKGQRVKKIIEKCNLKAEDVIFLDDNRRNRSDARKCNPGITTCFPSKIKKIAAQANEL